MLRVATAGIGLAWLVALTAFVIAVTSVRPDLATVLAALAVAAIAASCFMYAWREPAA
jgi:hypothetical protein